jgi:uncharacterized membrane protein YsdA (DUF1294 family)/cold shock CspA family protein
VEQLGKIIEWHDDRGFGFIAPLQGDSARIFFHIRDYRRSGRRPETGELVKYAAGQHEGRLRATSVRRAVAPARAKPAPVRARATPMRIPAGIQALFVLLYAGGLWWAIATQRLPPWFAFAVATMSVIAFMAYSLDKHAAQRHHWRTQESTLHLLELLCGWPGALIAQRMLRHKTRKHGYRVAFWCMVALNCGATAYWIAKS